MLANRVAAQGSRIIPGLKHEQVPQQVLMVLEPGDMLLPDPPYWFRAQEALLPNASFVKQGFRPLPQGASKPIRDRTPQSPSLAVP